MNVQKYHFYFFILKFIIILFFGLISMKIIEVQNNNKRHIIEFIDVLFKLSIGLFLIIFFSNNNCNILNIYDRVLLILAGFILILLADFKLVYRNTVELFSGYKQE